MFASLPDALHLQLLASTTTQPVPRFASSSPAGGATNWGRVANVQPLDRPTRRGNGEIVDRASPTTVEKRCGSSP